MTVTKSPTFPIDRLAAAYGQLIALADTVEPSPLAQKLADVEADILWRHLTEMGPATAGEALALLVQVRRQIGNIAFGKLEPGEAAEIAEVAIAELESALAFLINVAPLADRAAVAPVAAYHFVDGGAHLAGRASAAHN